MKYFEVTFTTTPCNETVNDVVSALSGEIGFESFVEWENGVKAYVQQALFDEEALKEMEWILEKFRKHRFEWTTEPITFSCGISEYASGLMTDKELFSITDKILYRAKENGKNRCLL